MKTLLLVFSMVLSTVVFSQSKERTKTKIKTNEKGFVLKTKSEKKDLNDVSAIIEQKELLQKDYNLMRKIFDEEMAKIEDQTVKKE